MLKIKNNELKESVESILARKNVKYNDWKKDVVNQKKLAVMADEDKEWLDEAVQTASIELVMADVANKKSNNNHQQNQKN